MLELLYSYFVSEFNGSPNRSISYQRIKRFLSHEEFKLKIDINNNPLHFLLKYGIIDSGGNNSFVLAKSIVLEGENCKVGINLNNQIVEANKHLVIRSKVGMTVFRNEDIDVNLWDIEIKKYCLQEYFSFYQDLWKVIDMSRHSDLPVNFNNSELFNEKNFGWKKNNEYKRNGLYKVYHNYHNSLSKNFDYYFYYKNKCILIKKDENERLNLVKTILSLNHNNLKYYVHIEKLILPKYFPLPSLIERFLILNHLLNTQDFPINREYYLSNKDFNFLNKNIFRNKILKSYE
nr:hypothetical protein [uncultured Flavobacterium sp.]